MQHDTTPILRPYTVSADAGAASSMAFISAPIIRPYDGAAAAPDLSASWAGLDLKLSPPTSVSPLDDMPASAPGVMLFQITHPAGSPLLTDS